MTIDVLCKHIPLKKYGYASTFDSCAITAFSLLDLTLD